VSWKCLVWISAGMPAILAEVFFVVFPSSRKSPWSYLS
jgi:hypothetical protein